MRVLTIDEIAEVSGGTGYINGYQGGGGTRTSVSVSASASASGGGWASASSSAHVSIGGVSKGGWWGGNGGGRPWGGWCFT